MRLKIHQRFTSSRTRGVVTLEKTPACIYVYSSCNLGAEIKCAKRTIARPHAKNTGLMNEKKKKNFTQALINECYMLLCELLIGLENLGRARWHTLSHRNFLRGRFAAAIMQFVSRDTTTAINRRLIYVDSAFDSQSMLAVCR